MATFLPDPQVAQVYAETIDYLLKASTAIAAGDFVAVDANGLLVAAGDISGEIFVGQAVQTVTSGASGSTYCAVIPISKLKIVKMKAVSPVQSWVGKIVSFSGVRTVALAATNTNDIQAGRVVFVDDGTAAGCVAVDTEDRFTILAPA